MLFKQIDLIRKFNSIRYMSVWLLKFQVKKSDRYILEEANYIKRAIEDEQAIQMLKDELSQDEKVGNHRRIFIY